MANADMIVSAADAAIMQLLDNVPVFSGIGLHEKHLVANKCHRVSADRDTVVIEQDDLSTDLFVILTGSVQVSKKIPSHDWVKINVLGPGDFFGEIAMLRGVRRTARVTTLTPCTFLTINGADFLEIYPFFPPQSRDNIQIIVAKRLAQLADLAPSAVVSGSSHSSRLF